jgi:sec-independent protein translocase protein TatC
VLIIVFIIAAILTPPDVLSQTAMAVPMYLLYEGGILFAAILARSSSAVEASEQGSA